MYKQGYNQAQDTINQMINLGIIMNGPPIKKQTLTEKKHTIRNFDMLIDIYNEWATKNPNIASVIDKNSMNNNIDSENSFWKSIFVPTDSPQLLQPVQQ